MVGVRTTSALQLWVDGEMVASRAHSSTARVDAASTTLDLSEGTLDSEVDEVAVWDRALTAVEIANLQASRDGWRPFSGEVYGAQWTPLPTARQWTLPAVDSTMRLDRSELVGVFASPAPVAAGPLLRSMLSLLDPPWHGTTYGLDLDTLIDRLVERGGPGSVAIDRVARLAEGVEWADAWDDLHLDRRGTTHLLDDTLEEDDFQPGWRPRFILEHFRTRTIARGGGISGGFATFETVGDGSTQRWVVGQQVRTVLLLLVDGVETEVGGSHDWSISADGLELVTTTTPASSDAIKLEFEVEAPLVSIAEDDALAALIGGHIVRRIEDRTIDDPETLAELARVTQAAHGAIGFEITGTLLPRSRARFLGVGGSPNVVVRGFVGRMTIMRLRTAFVSAGEQVLAGGDAARARPVDRARLLPGRAASRPAAPQPGATAAAGPPGGRRRAEAPAAARRRVAGLRDRARRGGRCRGTSRSRSTGGSTTT